MKGLDMFLIAIIILAVSAQIANNKEEFKKRIHTSNRMELVFLSIVFAIGSVMITTGFQRGRDRNVILGISGILVCIISGSRLINNFASEKTK